MTDFEKLLGTLVEAEVEFIIVGGAAAVAHGSSRLTKDLLGEIAGGGNYSRLRPHTVELEIFGRRCLCLDLPTLIEVKRAAGRPQDLAVIAELELIRSRQKAHEG